MEITRPTMIINYLCDNTMIGIQNTTARVEIPYTNKTLKDVKNDLKYFKNKVVGVAVRRCPFNQIQRVKCDIYAYILTDNNKGELIKLYENVNLVNNL